MNNNKSGQQVSIPHKKLINFLFYTKILASIEDSNEVNLIDSGSGLKLFFPPV